MYSINLYPEYAAHRLVARRRVGRAALLAVLLGLQGGLVGALIVSGLMFGEQAASLRAAAERQRAQASLAPATAAEWDLQQRLFSVRTARIDWSPKLAAVSNEILPALRLSGLEGSVAQKGKPARLLVAGVLRDPAAGAEILTNFSDKLRASNPIRSDFPEIALETVASGSANEFVVACRSPKKD